MDMLTEQDLSYYSDCNIKGLLRPDDVEGLIERIRTLQQQNEQMKEAFNKLDAIYDFGTPLEEGVRYSFIDVGEVNEVQREVKEVFDSIQGGTTNESGT